MNAQFEHSFNRFFPNRRPVAIILALLVGAGAYLFISRPSVDVATRTETLPGGPTLIIDFSAGGSAERIDLPQLSMMSRIADGRSSFKVPLRELPPGENALTYIVRKPWYLPDQQGSILLERPKSEVNYLVRVEPGSANSAWISIGGDPGNHILVFDPSGKVAFSGRQADHADEKGVVHVRFTEDDMSANEDPEGAMRAKISVTSPAGEVSDQEIVLRKSPAHTVAASVVFPPPGTVTDRGVVRVRILTEPGTTVRFGGRPRTFRGPQVEYDWAIPKKGKQTLAYEARAPGLRPRSGAIEVERQPRDSGDRPAAGAPALRISFNELAARADALSGETLALAGKVIAPPAASGAMELIEVGSGDEARPGEVAVVYAGNDHPPLQKGDRVIVDGTIEGLQRLRTAAGRTREVPKLRAAELVLKLQESAGNFESRYADLVETFWRSPEAPAQDGGGAPPVRVFASYDPWPETPPAQAREPVQRSEIVSGLAKKMLLEEWKPPEEEPLPEVAEAPAPPEKPARVVADVPLVEPAPAPDARGPVPEWQPVQRPEPPVAALESEPGDTGAGNAREEAPAGWAQYETEAVVAREKPPAARKDSRPDPRDEHVVLEREERAEAEKAALPPRPVLGQTAWDRDRTLEAELLGRGVSSVKIYRKGRSIRLRGSVPGDLQLRTVYQFINDKGFGEVDYGVEVK
ncbi:MAG: hypothetical protein ACE5FC_05010 [Myxococcota bacterium]